MFRQNTPDLVDYFYQDYVTATPESTRSADGFANFLRERLREKRAVGIDYASAQLAIRFADGVVLAFPEDRPEGSSTNEYMPITRHMPRLDDRPESGPSWLGI